MFSKDAILLSAAIFFGLVFLGLSQRYTATDTVIVDRLTGGVCDIRFAKAYSLWADEGTYFSDFVDCREAIDRQNAENQ